MITSRRQMGMDTEPSGAGVTLSPRVMARRRSSASKIASCSACPIQGGGQRGKVRTPKSLIKSQIRTVKSWRRDDTHLYSRSCARTNGKRSETAGVHQLLPTTFRTETYLRRHVFDTLTSFLRTAYCGPNCFSMMPTMARFVPQSPALT